MLTLIAVNLLYIFIIPDGTLLETNIDFSSVDEVRTIVAMYLLRYSNRAVICIVIDV